MKPNDVIEKVTSKLRPRRKNKTGSAIAVTAGIASAIWVALKFRRDLYGPGGTKLSRHKRSIDKVWPRD